MSKLKEASEIGSHGAPKKALRTSDRSQVGVLLIWTGLYLVTALQNCAISEFSCKRFSRYPLNAATCTLIVLGANPRSTVSLLEETLGYSYSCFPRLYYLTRR